MSFKTFSIILFSSVITWLLVGAYSFIVAEPRQIGILEEDLQKHVPISYGNYLIYPVGKSKYAYAFSCSKCHSKFHKGAVQ